MQRKIGLVLLQINNMGQDRHKYYTLCWPCLSTTPTCKSQLYSYLYEDWQNADLYHWNLQTPLGSLSTLKDCLNSSSVWPTNSCLSWSIGACTVTSPHTGLIKAMAARLRSYINQSILDSKFQHCSWGYFAGEKKNNCWWSVTANVYSWLHFTDVHKRTCRQKCILFQCEYLLTSMLLAKSPWQKSRTSSYLNFSVFSWG